MNELVEIRVLVPQWVRDTLKKEYEGPKFAEAVGKQLTLLEESVLPQGKK